jgi:hypothetical protein
MGADLNIIVHLFAAFYTGFFRHAKSWLGSALLASQHRAKISQ